ncbi:MAG: FlgD immunoglobulin-like domain containing protein, partial [Anaerolineae bacterium]
MPYQRLLKKLILGLLVVVIGSPPLLAFAKAQLAPRPLFADSPTYEALFSGLILQAIQQALPPDLQAELVSYEVSLRDSEQTDEVVRGEGAWRVTVRYTQGDGTQLDTLRGDAAFSVALLEDRSSGSIVSLRGSLAGAVSTAIIDVQVVSRFVPDVDYTQTSTFNVDLSYNGVSYPTSAERTERRFSPAFDVEERITTNTVTQGTQTTRLENRIVTRFVDLENSEVWIETTGTGVENIALRAHFWSSITPGVGFEYAATDYILTIDGQTVARLAEPGTISFNADGVQGSLAFIDEVGERFSVEGELLSFDPPTEAAGTPRRFGQPRSTAPRSHPLESSPDALPPRPVLAMPLFGPCAAANAAGGAAGAAAGSAIGTAIEIADALADFYDGLAAAGIASRAGDARAVAENTAAGGVLGAGAGIITGIATNVLGNILKDRLENNPNLTPEQRAERSRQIDWAMWGINFSVGLMFVTSPAGLAAAVIVAGLSMPGGPLDAATSAASDAAGGLCNADPYFTQPDSPTRLLRSRAGPVEIRFVQQGTYELPPSSSPPSDTSSAPIVEFRDNPNALVSGAIPTGAIALGAWVWDDARPFNGRPSHRSTGTGVHYFIGAEPYTLADDEELIQYVYLNPDNPPRQIYVQIYIGDGNGEQRAYWGQNLAQTGGEGGTASLYPMGPIPPAGQWLRLRIPAEALELRGQPITGVLFGVVEGEAWWGTMTSAPRATDTAPDVKVVSGGLTRLPAQAGVQIGVQVREAGLLNAQIVTADGAVVRTLWNAPVQPGLRALTWDGTADDGSPAPAGAKSVVVALNGVEIARADVGSPALRAQILSPGPHAVIRGNTVPIIGIAEGEGFQQYILEYGEGTNPTEWTRISSSVTPAALPRPERRVGFAQANLGVWNVGLDEFGGYNNAGLHGLYTLRLRVIGAAGDEAVATVPVIVGRLAAFATGNTITSPDGVVQLNIPPGALTETFVLIGILPVEQTQPAEAATLPANVTPLSGIYEILPPEDRFSDTVTLSISSSRADAVLMLGDGTAEGWRALPTTYDPDQQRLSASVLDFGQRDRAMIGAFVADNLPLATPAAPAFVTAPAVAPRLIADPQAVAFYDDFASGSAWRLLDQSGTQAEVVTGAVVGLPDGAYALRVTRATRTGARYIQITDAPFDAAQFPIVTFDYRVQPGDGFNLLARVGNRWLQVDLSGVRATASSVRTAQDAPLIADSTWHTAQIDLYRLLREAFPSMDDFTVNQLALGQFEQLAYDQVLAVDRGVAGQSYEITRVAVLRPVNQTTLTLQAADGSSLLTVNGQPNAEVTLPAADGLHWLEVRHANYPASAFFPVLVDRTPPQFLNPSPAEGGVGSPFSLAATLSELSGLDLTQARLSVNGTEYALPRRGAIVEPPTITLLLGSLDPAPAVPHQSEVVVALNGASDYAGNQQPVPFEWRFTVNTPPVQRDDLRQVSSGGASTPALSPQGEFIAYVADRDGQPTLLIARTDAPQTTLAALPNSRGAAWSPAGDRIAYVQRTVQGDALQVADFNADGTLSSPTTLLSAGFVESPSWSPDGEDLAVVVDGNVARVNTRTRTVEPLTNDPERPYRAVAWSRDGSALALAFDLYERRLELLRLSDGSITPLTEGLEARQPAWLNASTVLFSAPREGSRGTQIWQVDINSRAAALFDLDAPPGADDDQVIVSADGGTIAFVSTRGGERDVWVQRALQIADLRLIPAEAAPGEPIQIAYSLPADATVSIAAAGVEPSTIISEQAQSRGLQQVTWNTSDLATGVYQVRVLAQIGDRVIEQAAELRLIETTLAPTPTVPPFVTPQVESTPTPPLVVGVGRLEVNAYRDESSSLRAQGLTVEAFISQTETLVERSVDLNPAVLRLETGLYDVRLTYQNAAGETIVHTFRAVEVIANEQVSLSHPAATGELRVDVLSGEGVTSFNDARIFVYRAGDREAPIGSVAYSTSPRFDLQEGRYDVVVQLRTSLAEELTHTFTDVMVEPGRTTRLAHIFPTGRVRITANASETQEAFREPAVTAYR